MPFYEYQATEMDRSCSFCKEVFEISQSILSDFLTECPECGCRIKKLFPLTAGIIIKGREANQFNDIQAAKYWRDKNGVRHPVTPSDGFSTSSTVNQSTVTPGEAAQRTKKDRKASKKERLKATSVRAAIHNREQIKKSQSFGDGHITVKDSGPASEGLPFLKKP